MNLHVKDTFFIRKLPAESYFGKYYKKDRLCKSLLFFCNSNSNQTKYNSLFSELALDCGVKPRRPLSRPNFQNILPGNRFYGYVSSYLCATGGHPIWQLGRNSWRWQSLFNLFESLTTTITNGQLQLKGAGENPYSRLPMAWQ